jgi:uncharacterized protein
MTSVLLDTNVIVAVLDKRDRDHARCRRILRQIDQPIVTCEAVITESCHLLGHVPGASETILKNLEEGLFEIRFKLPASITAVQSLLNKYADLPMDFADACLVQMADELDTGDILTLDSDFLHYRWRKTKRFNLLVPLE